MSSDLDRRINRRRSIFDRIGAHRNDRGETVIYDASWEHRCWRVVTDREVGMLAERLRVEPGFDVPYVEWLRSLPFRPMPQEWTP